MMTHFYEKSLMENEMKESEGIFTPTNTQLLAGYCRNSKVNNSISRSDFGKKEKDEPAKLRKRTIQLKVVNQRITVNNSLNRALNNKPI